MSVSTSEPRARDHVPALDGIRAVAILIVILHHSFRSLRPGTLGERIFHGAASLGFCGVDAFFALSGFLITSILLRSRGSATYFRTFYARRAFRIFPVYYAFLVGLFVVWPRFPPAAPWFRQLQDNQAWYWTYCTNILIAVEKTWAATPFYTQHLWSLAVEEQFYFVWPLLVLVFAPRRLLQVTAALFAGSALLRLAAYAGGADEGTRIALYVLTPTRLEPLMAGAAVAILREGPGGLAPHLRRIRIAGWLSLAGLAALVAVKPSTEPALTGGMQLVGYPLLAVLFAAVVADVAGDRAAPGRGILARVLATPVLRFLGKYSYAIYLFHHTVIWFFSHSRLGPRFHPTVLGSHVPAYLAYFLAITALSTLAALVSWHLIEQPFIRLKDRFPVESDDARVGATYDLRGALTRIGERVDRHANALLGLGLVAHAALVARFLPLRSVFSREPLLETDYAHHHHSVATMVTATREFGHHWAYDPAFCAGYPAGTIFDVDVKLIGVVSWALSLVGVPVALSFNVTVLGFFLLPPLLVLAVARSFDLKPGPTVLVVGAATLVWHADRMLVRFNAQGMCSFVFATYWALFTAALLHRALAAPRVRAFAALAAATAVGMHVHILYPFLVAVPALALWLPGARTRPAKDHAALLLALLAALVANGWWLRSVFRFWSYRVPTTYGAPVHWGSLAELAADLRGGALVLAALGMAGFALARRSSPALARLGLWSLPWFFFLADLSAKVPVLKTLEPDRFRIALAVFGAVGVGLGIAASRIHERLDRGPAVLVPALLLVGVLGWIFVPYTPRLRRFRSGRGEYAELIRWVEKNTSKKARVAFMDRTPGFLAPTRLQHYVDRAFIGGPFSQMNLVHNYANFNRVRLARTKISALTEADVARTADTFNIQWFVGATKESCDKLASYGATLSPREKILVEERAGDDWIFPREIRFPLCTFEVQREPSWFLEGSGEVEATLNRIAVRGASAGRVVLKFHWLPGMVTDPPLPIERHSIPNNPLGFIAVQNGDVRDFVIRNGYR